MLHREHRTPPRPSTRPQDVFTARQIFPTEQTAPLYDYFVSDQIAGLMLSSLLSLGSSPLTFAQAAKDRDGLPTVSVYLQPFASLSHVPQTPIRSHLPRSHHTHQTQDTLPVRDNITTNTLSTQPLQKLRNSHRSNKSTIPQGRLYYTLLCQNWLHPHPPAPYTSAHHPTSYTTRRPMHLP